MPADPIPDEYDEVYEIAIESSEDDKAPLADIGLDILEDNDIPVGEPGKRYVALTRGNRERENPSKRVEIQTDDAGDLEVVVTPDMNTGIGLFIHFLEQHGLDEEATMEGLRDPDLGFDIDNYLNWRDNLTMDDRRDRLLADAEDRRDRSPHVETYLEDGSFRQVAHNDIAERVGTKLYEGIDPNPRRCYRNTAVALNACKESDYVSYVEGLALPKQGGRAVAHAWLEMHGVVVDLTWPWHAPLPPEDAVYYGVPIDTETVLETTRRRGAGFNPILLDDSLLFEETV